MIMKNKILGVLFLFMMVCSVNSCGLFKKLSHKNDGNTVVAGTSQNMYQETHEYVQYQVDSMCVADNLPKDFEGWIGRAYQDYETNEYVIRYIYIKEMNDNYELVYIVTQKGDIFVVSKRKTISE